MRLKLDLHEIYNGSMSLKVHYMLHLYDVIVTSQHVTHVLMPSTRRWHRWWRISALA